MSSTPLNPAALANPRPGVIKTLGILNILFAILASLCIGYSAFIMYMASVMKPKDVVVTKVEIKVNPAPGASAVTPNAAGFNPFVGMDDPTMVRFTIMESGWGILVAGLMFATGIGLLNLKRWAFQWWWWLAWAKIVAVVLFWGYFIVGVIPSFSGAMAREATAMLAAQGMPAGRVPIRDLTRIYSIMNLIMALSVMVITSIYPAIALWLMSRPRVKAAIVAPPLAAQPALEPELP